MRGTESSTTQKLLSQLAWSSQHGKNKRPCLNKVEGETNSQSCPLTAIHPAACTHTPSQTTTDPINTKKRHTGSNVSSVYLLQIRSHSPQRKSKEEKQSGGHEDPAKQSGAVSQVWLVFGQLPPLHWRTRRHCFLPSVSHSWAARKRQILLELGLQRILGRELFVYCFPFYYLMKIIFSIQHILISFLSHLISSLRFSLPLSLIQLHAFFLFIKLANKKKKLSNQNQKEKKKKTCTHRSTHKTQNWKP